jgi:hypothetical protein
MGLNPGEKRKALRIVMVLRIENDQNQILDMEKSELDELPAPGE